MDADDIALLDFPHRKITLVGIQVGIDLLAIHGHTILWTLCITISVKVAGHHLVAHPSRNADLEAGVLRGILCHLNLDITVPGILGGLFQHHILAPHLDGGSVGCEEVHIDIIALHAIEITWEGRDEAAQVAGTAGTAKPGLACGGVVGIEGILAVARQGVGVEEPAAVHTHARDDTII